MNGRKRFALGHRNIRIGRFRFSRAVQSRSVKVNGTGSVVVPAPAGLQGLSDHFVFFSDKARHSVLFGADSGPGSSLGFD